MIGRNLPKNRKFTFEPQYYDPEKEKREGHAIKFKRPHARKAAKQKSLIWLFTLLGIIGYFIYFFSKLGK